MRPLPDHALHLTQLGLSVIPIRTGGTKTPPFSWKQFQTTPATPEQVRKWWETNPTWGLGVITGTASRGLIMIELESDAMPHLATLTQTAIDRDMIDLWTRVLTGWSENTPTGGLHMHIHLDADTIPGNTKLARKKDGHPLAETRGEGGLTVVAPTPGACHPTGNPWTPYMGAPENAPILTRDEYEQVCDLLASINEYAAPAREPLPAPTSTPNGAGEGVKPGDDFENKTTWDDILTPHGWQRARREGPGWAWVRPGKNPRDGISATTGQDPARDRLYVFSTSTPFETEKPYTKFGAYALLNHGGDHSAAARALAKEGYGERLDKDIVIDLPVRALHPAPAPVTNSEASSSKQTTGNTVAKIVPIQAGKAKLRDLTEDANALLLTHVHTDTIRYIRERGLWCAWNGHAWMVQPRGGGIVREHAKTLMRHLPSDGSLAAWRKRSLTNSGVTNMLALACTDPALTISQDDLDQHLDEINTPGGIVNLRTSKLTPPDPARLHTKSTLCAPKNQDTPLWDAFLAETFAGHDAVATYIQPLLGYMLTGRIGAQILPFFYGAGANGKSVIAEVIVQLMGDYALTTPSEFLIRTGREQHPTEIARLHGARLAVAAEVPKGSRFDEVKIKQLTGGDSLAARFMHGDFFTFKPTHKLLVLGNDRPKVIGGGYSFWRRFRLIPFTNTVPEEKRDPALVRKLIDSEGPGIMAWLVKGARTYYETGLQAPPEVLAATEEYEAEEDHIGRFIEDRLIIGGGETVRVSRRDMRRAYTAWCDFEGVPPMTAHAFTRELRDRYGIGVARSNGTHLYTNVCLSSEDETSSASSPWNDLGGGTW